MQSYNSKKSVLLILDILSIVISFIIAIGIRFNVIVAWLGSSLIVKTYVMYLLVALGCYIILFIFRREPRIEYQSYREIIYEVAQQQFFFTVTYIVIFFVFHHSNTISRLVVLLFYLFSVVCMSVIRILYHIYCVYRRNDEIVKTYSLNKEKERALSKDGVQHIYIIGSKSIGQYGGYESFVMNLLKEHKNNKKIRYHIACKANGAGCVELEKMSDVMRINDEEFLYCNAHCFTIKVPERLGAAQAIVYDIKALDWCCNHIKNNHIENPIVYILASRVGIFEKSYVNYIHDAGGQVWHNPDGLEFKRRKWSPWIRKYWKLSERYAIKNADLVICDSQNIEKYIKTEYEIYHPQTTFIPYGSYIVSSNEKEKNSKYDSWLNNHNLKLGNYYLVVCRFVPENNFDVIIREFMASKTTKDLAIVTTENVKYSNELQQKYQYKKDKRIKFVGSVYDNILLTKIRENAFAYIHGHEVGGTNPSLLEALGTTKLNLLYEIGFNKEVGKDAALYFTKEDGNLENLIDNIEKLTKKQIDDYGQKAKQRIKDDYTWENVANKYEKLMFG